MSNDTSIGTGYAPLSRLERTVLDIERHLTAAETRRVRPHLGADVKVMGVRSGERCDLTVAVAFVDRFIFDAGDYARKKQELALAIASRASGTMGSSVEVVVNAADDLDRGAIYLTVSGTSAEAGDDGETGRGNRANGLIAPYRLMTMEAVAGKNPINHVGKLYNVAAARLAEEAAKIEGVAGAECCLVSRIGASIDRPRVVHLRVLPKGRTLESLRGPLTELVQSELEGLPALWKPIVRGELTLF